MIPLRVSLEGFLSYQEKQVIDFDGSSLWMLWGPNGVGKSAVFDAITFALFNSHRGGRGTKSNPKELINHHVNKLVVEFDFIVDGVAYRIRRTCPRKGHPTREICVLQKDDSDGRENMRVMRIDGTEDEDGFKDWVDRKIGLDYSAFTSSVLLLQGRSEQLLNADPKGRYEILAEIIDLLRYQRLHEAADAQRKKHVVRKDVFEQQLQSTVLRPISDEEMDVARIELQRMNEGWQRIQAQVGQLMSWFEQAKQWEQDTAELERRQTELQNALEVLAKEEEITCCFAEWQMLCGILPSLKQIIGQQELLHEKTQCIAGLQTVYEQLKAKSRNVEKEQKDAEQHATQLGQALENLRRTKEQYSERLLELGPMVERLELIEEWQAEIKSLDAEISQFPPNIAQRFGEAEQLVRVLQAEDEALPWLRSFGQARAGFSKTLNDKCNARIQTEMLHQQLQDLEHTYTSRSEEYAEASRAERHLLGEVAGANRRFKDTLTQLKKFEDAATKPVCELCGQEITGDHVQREKLRLQNQMEEAKDAYEELNESHQKAQDQKQSKEQELSSLREQIEGLTKKYDQGLSNQQQYNSQANQLLQQLRDAYNNVKRPFKECIITIAPVDDMDWLETVYPTEADLKALQLELASKSDHELNLSNLRQDFDHWHGLNDRKRLIQQQLVQPTLSFDLGLAKEARDEKASIEQERQSLDNEIQQQSQDYQEADELARQVNDEWKKLEADVQQTHIDLEAEKATLAEMKRTLSGYKESLSGDWQARADSLNAEGLIALESRQQELALYENLLEKLKVARQSRVTYKQRIDELNKEIESCPPGARRPAVEIEGELENQKELLNQADAKRNEANQQLAGMEKQRQQRQELEERKREADRLAHLYKILVDLLGRGGLQLYLLSRAEKTIVELANKTLSGLSHSRMRLELRRDSDATLTQTEQALDLVVYDYDTGQHAIPIRFVSGSQRFRIAVSLALAIGRYTSREARRIESVIIDEGFGSLDKTGRDDMIEELNALREQLARIILVSHQDEFANAFSDRYSFSLVSGASHVSLMVDE